MQSPRFPLYRSAQVTIEKEENAMLQTISPAPNPLDACRLFQGVHDGKADSKTAIVTDRKHGIVSL